MLLLFPFMDDKTDTEKLNHFPMTTQQDNMTGRMFFTFPEARGTAFPKPGFCIQGIITVASNWIVKEGSGYFTERT